MGLSEGQVAPRAEVLRGDEMRTPDEVAAMLRLKALGWGIKRIARELGCSHMTVRRYVAEGGYVPYHRPVGRPRALAGLDEWLAERFRRHGGNADVVRQELLAEKGIALSLRTIEREVAPLRRELAAEARATIRFETPPGHQLQIDFGERRILIGAVPTKVFLFGATLGFSRRLERREALEVHKRLASAGKKPKVIIVAVMRKMITTLNAMLRDGAGWQPQAA